MKICVVGTGYVGLVVGTCFAETGHQVICVDQDQKKIASLQKGGVPIYEPGLPELLKRNTQEGRLHFTTELAQSVRESQIIFISVGTPSLEGGDVDLQAVLQVAKEIALAMDAPKIVVMKSTTPCGTSEEVEKVIAKHSKHAFDVVVNPEFLKEGVAIDDFLRPDRVIIGLEKEALKSTFQRLYEPFLRTGKPIFFMSRASAEMTKYAANGILALRISYINEIANLCDRLGADIEAVRRGVGADARIGYPFLFPGVGYGGSCFPKDIDALVRTAEKSGSPLLTLQACAEVNRKQHHVLSEKIKKYFQQNLSGKKIAIWGLSFKPRTDDMRDAPSLAIIEDLLRAGASVAAFDPVAMPIGKQVFAERGIQVELCKGAYEATQGAHALALVTEWNEFRRPDWKRLKECMAQAAIFDGRNIFAPDEVKEAGFDYQGIGRNT